MSITEQINEFATFAKRLAAERGESDLSLDTVIEEWKSLNHADIEAVRAALATYDQGEKGMPVREFLAQHRSEQARQET